MIIKRRLKKRKYIIKRRIKQVKQQTQHYYQTKITETQHLKNIRKYLALIAAYGYRQSQVFTDWIELMFWAFQRKDPEYLKVTNRYKNDQKKDTRPADYFSFALGELLAHMKLTNEEVLGYLYMEFSAFKGTGQFFTPQSLTDLMAKIVSGDKELKGNICDPACGAGGNLIACCKNMSCKNVDKSCFYGQDIDFTCVQMTALNLMFFNLNGVVILGNTLNLEAQRVFLTKRSYLYGGSLCEDPNPEKWQQAMRNMFIQKPIIKRRTVTNFIKRRK